jgi:hypothetical protein
MNSRGKAPDLARRGGLQKHQNDKSILQHRIEQAKLQRQKTLGIFRRRMADRIRAAKAAGSPLLDEWIRFRAIQLCEWQSEASPTRTEERSMPERGVSHFNAEKIPAEPKARREWINKQRSTEEQQHGHA